MSDVLKIGWAETDITPPVPVVLRGQFHARVAEEVKDPLKATAMALESKKNGESVARFVMVSCDLVSISECIISEVRSHIQAELPELDPGSVIIFATHTHTGPENYSRPRYRSDGVGNEDSWGIELTEFTGTDYVKLASRRIADAIKTAWSRRSASGVSYGLGQAVVGRNRLISYFDGSSRMYGKTNEPGFSHVEGYEDHSVNFLATYSPDGRVTGLVVNLACPSQVDGGAWMVSADFWHETREELRKYLGDDLYVLPQVSAAGDQNSRPPVNREAEMRMARLAGYTGSDFDIWRRELAVRIARSAARVLELIRGEIDWNPVVNFHHETVDLPRRILTRKDVDEALAESKPHKERYQQLLEEISSIPLAEREERWYRDLTRAFRRANRGQNVLRRYEEQERSGYFPVELAAVRIGDVGFVMNPFELYLDYGMRIKARSPAMQTFVVQLAGPGSYLPTARSIQGGAYGAVPASTEVGVEGGNKLVEWSLETLNSFWHDK